MNTPRILFLLRLAAGIANAQAQDNPTPAPATEPAQTEMQKWIATTDAPWQAAFKRDVTDVHEAELNKLKLQFLTSLETGIAKASGSNDLDGAVALRNEQKRFAESNVFPEQDLAAEAASVKQIRAATRVQLARIEKENAAHTKALHVQYDAVLAQAQTQLTLRQRIDDALLVKAKREEVAAAWITPAVAAASEKVMTPASARPASTANKTNPGTTPAAAGTKGAFDEQLAKLVRNTWTWETGTGKSSIKFEKDETCVHTHFNGTFEFLKENSVKVNMAQRSLILEFNFGKGEFTSYDGVLQQKIAGRRTKQK